MTAFLLEYGLFAAKTLTILLGIFGLFAMIAAALREARQWPAERLEIEPVSARIERLRDGIEEQSLPESVLKKLHKQRLQAAKEKNGRLAKVRAEDLPPRVFVLDFVGDIAASATVNLREEITAILQVARPQDEVLLRLESEGGVVHGYGLAASQLQRLRARKLRLTVAVDKVAASGGYLMACVADEIIAAPFAIVGSIGVVAQVPNVHRLLQKHDVDMEVHTAGEYKRTLSIVGRNTEAGRRKFREELDDTHALFKEFVAAHRPQLDLETVATGEHWFGTRAQALRLVDQLLTSDDWLLARFGKADLFGLRYRRRKPLSERLQFSLFKLLSRLVQRSPLGDAASAASHTRFML